MDTDLIRTFEAIRETGSFTAAARQVGRTQSAVSLQMKRLEDQIGRPLFIRSRNPVETHAAWRAVQRLCPPDP